MNKVIAITSLCALAIYLLMEPYSSYLNPQASQQVLSDELVSSDSRNELSIPVSKIDALDQALAETTQSIVNREVNRADTSQKNSLTNPNGISGIEAIEEKTALHESILVDHKKFRRYPPSNTRFDNSQKDPTSQRYSLDVRTTREEDSELALTIWSDQKFYLIDDQAKIYASLEDQNQHRKATTFGAHLIYNETENLFPLEFSDADKDGIYESVFKFKQSELSQRPGVYKVLIVSSQNELADSVVFVLSEPEATFTGNYRDRISDKGNLIIEAELSVAKHNRFAIEASLYSSTDDPIGHTQQAVTLETGTHWVPLTYHGLLFHDANEPGPYHLKHTSLAKVSIPIQRAPLVTTSFYTQGYTVEQFSSNPHQQ